MAIIVLELGFREEGGLLWPYRVLYDALPGWDAIRTPGRLATFSSLALALLAAAGGEALLRAVRRTPLPAWSPVRPSPGLLVLVIVTEGRSLPFDPFDNQAMPEVPPAQASTNEIPTPQLHLPALTAKENRAYQLASTDGFPDMVNGRASTNPAVVLTWSSTWRTSPTRRPSASCRTTASGRVILHLGLTEGTPQAGAARKSIEGLPLTACRLPGLIVYEVGSSSASPRPSAGSARRRGLRLRLSPCPRAAGTRSSVSSESSDARRDQPEGRHVASVRKLISYLASDGRDGRDTGPAEHRGNGQAVVGEQRGRRRPHGEDDRDQRPRRRTGASASQALVTPRAVRTVCSSRPWTSQSAQVPIPCLPISG